MENKSEINEDLITASEAARELGVSAGSVRNYEARGILKAFRLSDGTRVFDRNDVIEFKAKRERL